MQEVPVESRFKTVIMEHLDFVNKLASGHDQLSSLCADIRWVQSAIYLLPGAYCLEVWVESSRPHWPVIEARDDTGYISRLEYFIPNISAEAVEGVKALWDNCGREQRKLWWDYNQALLSIAQKKF